MEIYGSEGTNLTSGKYISFLQMQRRATNHMQTRFVSYINLKSHNKNWELYNRNYTNNLLSPKQGAIG